MLWSNQARAPQLLKPTCLEPVLCNRRSHRNKKPMHLNEDPMQTNKQNKKQKKLRKKKKN